MEIERSNNFTKVSTKDGVYAFSYDTLVAFKHVSGSWTVSKNEWGNTTGKHLNSIDGGTTEAKALRVPQSVVAEMADGFLAFP